MGPTSKGREGRGGRGGKAGERGGKERGRERERIEREGREGKKGREGCPPLSEILNTPLHAKYPADGQSIRQCSIRLHQ